MLFYTGDLPEDQYVPEDFIDGPTPLRFIDDMACRKIVACNIDKRHPGAQPDPKQVIDGEGPLSTNPRECHPELSCADAEKRVLACSGVVWCCPLLPAQDAASPAVHGP